LKAGEWLRRGRRGIGAVPPWSAAAEQYHLSGCPISPGHFSVPKVPVYEHGELGARED